MNPTTAGDRDVAPPPEPCAALSVGLLYLDVRKGRLYWLNEAARQLHGEGLAALGTEPALAQMRTPAGEGVVAEKLPLAVAARQGSPVEASFVLSQPGKPDCHLHWSAAPLHDGAGQVFAVLAAVCCTPPPPDWHALAGLAHDLRSPLQAIRFLSTALGHESASAPPRGEELSRLSSAAERALQVGTDLLEWCRTPVQGGRRVEPAWFALDPFLAGLVRDCTLRDFLQHEIAVFRGISRVGGFLGGFAEPPKRAIIARTPHFLGGFRRSSVRKSRKVQSGSNRRRPSGRAWRWPATWPRRAGGRRTPTRCAWAASW